MGWRWGRRDGDGEDVGRWGRRGGDGGGGLEMGEGGMEMGRM